ncbi:hypothetical protein [Methanolobus halotolerans]|uniref:Polysaccharide deacetylase n=1 Tax=Methanolobus halotolerans TaxID=2052935 RepID=A0A4E0QXZ5_9EURY|nr:hypothetical protein [Methanolobus halotolerans]TGC08368.1 hypothetical protein CUN85_09485 [Methanolobus halotolerans]
MNRDNNFDFTLDKYKQLCSSLERNNFSPITLAEYMMAKELPDKYVMMRHDIDRNPPKALETAKIEQELNIKATYYFRTVNDNLFCPEIITEVSRMGHEIGYHYEVLNECKGNYENAIELFKANLDKFQDLYDVKTVCMHGQPLSKHDNRDLWKKYDYRDFGILGEAYLSIDNSVNYLCDTGRNWNFDHCLRDFIPNKTESIKVDSTDDLIELIESGNVSNFYILTHPERWSSNSFEWVFFYSKDMIINLGKKFLRMARTW